MLLGSAGTGKTSLKRSLMEEPFNPHTTSTIVSDVSSVRPFGHEWQTMRGNKWREATEEDEIQELAHLFESSCSSLSSHCASESNTQNSQDELESTSLIASFLNVESHIQSVLKKAGSTSQTLTTKAHVQPFLHIWDCGGQPVFLEILPAFLTPRTMFLLLFDASKDFRERWQSRQNTPDGKVLFGEVVNESTSDLMAKWMSTIHSHLMKHNKDDTSSPNLYCIGTRGDKLKAKWKRDQVKKQIQSLYEEKEFSDLIKDVLIIDNTTSGKGEREDSNIAKLRESIDSFITKLVIKTPINWVLFRKILQELKLNVISVSIAIAIGATCHIPAADVPEVLKFYHELGAVLYYPQIEGLEDKLILSPKWFVDTIGKVFTLEGCKEGWSGTRRWYLLRNDGILVQSLYQEVWRSSGIDPEEIIELLVHFRLAAQVQTELYDSRFKQYFLPAVLQGYTGDPNEVRPGYKLRASPVHITFSTGYVPPGFFTRLATAVATDASVELNFENGYVYAVPGSGFFDRLLHRTSKLEIKSIYRNRVCFSYGRPSDDFVLTDVHTAIQVDVLRYAPESSHPVSLKLVCQKILKILEECCQQVEDTLSLYHGHHADRSSRKVQYVCQCSPFSEVHYIQDIDAENQTCSHPVYCKMERCPRHLNDEESVWFNDNMLQERQLQEIPPLEEIIIKDDHKPTIHKVDSTAIHSPTKTSESNDDQHKGILTIKNLVDIIRVLEKGYFQNKKWFDLGLYLGLIHNDLKTIEDNYPRDAKRCLRECLALWLTDDIEATWDKLAIAVGEVGDTTVAEYIRSTTKEL
ncbi:PREDICTED: probable serine/threonine-protein kinase qkgA [Amphimedon queenslandica]|nr:PREDICTED: probable serine/threonine-protein kinase qkgA [Amphimedon queenslandica]|eukprot:XP_019861708.1 PREDICTED: probable serine/threonine-protein kinase qkgA [Amphimedon queenslandica]